MAYTDADLLSYLRGDGDPATAGAIEADLTRDAALEERLMALDPIAEPIKAAFDGVAPADPAAFVPETPAQAPSRWPHALTLVAAGLVGAAVMFGTFNLRSPAPDWRMQVANYQALYGPETVGGALLSAEERAFQTEQAGAKIALAGLEAVTGVTPDLTHVRTQILQVDGTPLAQIVFRTADGQPVALCGLPHSGASSDAIAVMDRADLASAAFETAGHSWLLIGTDDLDFIATQAEVFQAALDQV